MSKITVAAALALAVMGASFASAQQAPIPVNQPPPAAAATAPRWSAEDSAAFTEARIAAVKAGLALRADQERPWAMFETVMREAVKQQADRIAQVRSGPTPNDPVALLRRRADELAATAMTLRQLADAADPLYRSLDDAQKRRMIALVAADRR